jgi:adenosylmethionine-8-amino-7-oxononanoate aminotransferase
VGDVRGLGMMCGVEFVQDRATKAEFPASEGTGMKVLLAMLERGVYSRVRGDVLLVAPPLITPREVMDEAVDAVADAVRAVLG